MPNAQSYRVEYIGEGPNAAYNMITVLSPFVTLENLVPQTPYKYTVTALYGPENTAEVTQGVFTTHNVCKAHVFRNLGNQLQQVTNSTPAPEGAVSELGRLDLRVGRIADVQVHSDADTLYVSKILTGDETPR